MYVSIIRMIIICLSIFLLIIINPSKWKTGVFAILQQETFQEVKTYIGVIDRIENNKVVILVDNNHEEIQLHKNHIQEEYSEGTWLLINEYSDGTYGVTVQSALTEKHEKKSRNLIKQLLKRKK